MKVLVVGASGATGKQLVEQLIIKGITVKAVVRSVEKLPESWKNNKQIELIVASILELSDEEVMELTFDCQSIASCLGHNLTWKGIYGKPRRLVTDAAKKLCNAVEANKPDSPVKYLLMNTTGNRNRDINEPTSVLQKCVIVLIRLLLPPHLDNEQAADYLRIKRGQNNQFIEWTAVRPDGLINEEEVTDYEIHPSPTRSAIFNAGKVSRINVGHFMARLINETELWKKWKGQMPVIYNKSSLIKK
ncbi:MAG: SDR family oxidoreductase [Flavobacteriales bacterium]